MPQVSDVGSLVPAHSNPEYALHLVISSETEHFFIGMVAIGGCVGVVEVSTIEASAFSPRNEISLKLIDLVILKWK